MIKQKGAKKLLLEENVYLYKKSLRKGSVSIKHNSQFMPGMPMGDLDQRTPNQSTFFKTGFTPVGGYSQTPIRNMFN